jgi:hypothetical protein
LDDTKWVRWLRATTGQDSVRGIAKAVGVSHTTVQRWATAGVPPPTVWEITLRFKGDPIAALVVLDRVPADKVQQLNLAAVVRYADADILTGELHSRAMREAVKQERSDAFDGLPFRMEDEKPPTRSPGVPLGRSDAMRQQSFRLSSKES